MFDFKSPAKINRFLKVGAPLSKGYHEIASAMQFLDFYDELRFTPNTLGQIELIWKEPEIKKAPKRNLITRAANLLRSTLDQPELGATIEIKKIIPIGSGLGGGSSNAATTLVALNALWKGALSEQQLIELGKKLGSDVPFFIYGKAAYVFGIGTSFFPKNGPEQECLMIPPAYGPQNTTLAFYHLKRLRASRRLARPSLKYKHSQGLRLKTIADWSNDFEAGLKERNFATWKLLVQLRTFCTVGLTGTGNALIATGRPCELTSAHLFLKSQKISHFFTKICNSSALFQ